MQMDVLVVFLGVAILIALFWLGLRIGRSQRDLPASLAHILEEKHRVILADLHEGLARQAERLGSGLGESDARLRAHVSQELNATREAVHNFERGQRETLAQTRESMLQQLAEMALAAQRQHDGLRGELMTRLLETLSEQSRAEQELIRKTMHGTAELLTNSVGTLNATVESRLNEIGGKVTERLEEGFKKTNETFANVMARLATIDEAQRKIDGLTSNVISLQELLGDKRSRGAFGEIQLEAMIRNCMPVEHFAMQYTLSNGMRVDCVLRLPEPTGTVAIDSKFPLENYHRMFDPASDDIARAQAQRLFKADVKRHVDAISQKYIIANETCDGAVMFLPAEAVFAEIHAYHPDIVDYAMQKRVWIVSPTTLMAVLNTARAVLKDVEMRRQVHIIKDALGKLGKDFALFDQRMKKLADHIRQAGEDVDAVHISSRKITQRFAQIESVELDAPLELEAPDLESAADIVRARTRGKDDG